MLDAEPYMALPVDHRSGEYLAIHDHLIQGQRALQLSVELGK
jgi:hypothetical protein